MVDAPEIGLAGGMEAPILGAIAAIHVRTFTEQHLEELSLNWIEDGSRDSASALVALVIAARLARSGRTDLASLVGATRAFSMGLGSRGRARTQDGCRGCERG